MTVLEPQLARFGEIVARLARPLADRSAVLWLMRLDEASFAALEESCLRAIALDAPAAAIFAQAYARTHALLGAPTHDTPASPAAPQPRATARTVNMNAAAGVTPRGTATPPDTAKQALIEQLVTVALPSEPALDPGSAMFTLASNIVAPKTEPHPQDPPEGGEPPT